MMKKSFAMLLTLLFLAAFVQPTSAHTVHDGAAPELLNKKMQIHTIAAGYIHTVAIREDGTVVAVGDNEYGQCDVSDWTDIIAVAAGELHTVGLKADGTVVAVGRNNYTQINVSGLSDVVQIAAGGLHTVALKADGSVVSIGARKQGQGNACDWTNIRVPQR